MRVWGSYRQFGTLALGMLLILGACGGGEGVVGSGDVDMDAGGAHAEPDLGGPAADVPDTWVAPEDVPPPFDSWGPELPHEDTPRPPPEDVPGPEPDVVVPVDVGPAALGTMDDPIVVPGHPRAAPWEDARDTSEAHSDHFDRYPGWEHLDESGREFVYRVEISEPLDLRAWIDDPEPAGVDVDLHLLSRLEPLALLDRGHHEVGAALEPGVYYLILDTFVEGGTELAGPYHLRVELRGRHAGTVDDPIELGGVAGAPLPLPFQLRDARDTSEAASDVIDAYPGWEWLGEAGPEVIYRFTLDRRARLVAALHGAPAEGVDIDLHLLRSLEPLDLVARDHTRFYTTLEPGTYYLVADSYSSSDGTARSGAYELRLGLTAAGAGPEGPRYFNDFILMAIDYLHAEYGLLGYDIHSVLTHDLTYGDHGVISATNGAKTMCVAAVLEVIVTALQIWADERGDDRVFDFLPLRSWQYLGEDDIKAYLWVNYDLDAAGSADALTHFGMGETRRFEELEPGSFINVNRTTGYGHAVVFTGYVDVDGNEYTTYDDDVIGFTYFSSQGGPDVGEGGLDVRYALFATDEYEANGYPAMPYLRDVHIIRSEDQGILNTGMMFSPEHWIAMPGAGAAPRGATKSARTFPSDLVFDGRTIDD